MKRTRVKPMENRGMLRRPALVVPALSRSVPGTARRTGRRLGTPPWRFEEALEHERAGRERISGVVKAAGLGRTAFGAWPGRRCRQRTWGS